MTPVPCSEPLCGPGPGAVLLVLLVAGHCVGDFVLQTDEMVRRKGEPKVLLRHGAVVALAHFLFVVPFLGPAFAGRLLVAVAAIGAAHVLVDRVKALGRSRQIGGLSLFLLDQVLHLAVIVSAWLLLVASGLPSGPAFAPPGGMAGLAVFGALVAAVAFNVNGGSGVVEAVLERWDLTEIAEADSGLAGSGRVIGILERLLALTLVLVGAWAALVLLAAVKSIARFAELDDRPFAEYYLVGTLTSLLVAMMSGLALRVLGLGA